MPENWKLPLSYTVRGQKLGLYFVSSFPARVPIFGSIFYFGALTSAVLSRVRVALFVDIRQFFVRIYREIKIIYMLILMLIQSKPYIVDALYSDFFRKNGRLKL